MNAREQTTRMLNVELDALDAGLAMYEARLRKLKSDTQRRLQHDFDFLRRKRDETRKEITSMLEARGEAIEKVDDRARALAREFRRALERARERLDAAD